MFYPVSFNEDMSPITLTDEENTLLILAKKIDDKEEFYKFFTSKDEQHEIHGGFALCHWNEESNAEEIVKKDLNVTIRCIPLDAEVEDGKCIISGKKSVRRVIFAKSY